MPAAEPLTFPMFIGTLFPYANKKAALICCFYLVELSGVEPLTFPMFIGTLFPLIKKAALVMLLLSRGAKRGRTADLPDAIGTLFPLIKKAALICCFYLVELSGGRTADLRCYRDALSS
jgi:hypothetical protein